MAKVYVFLADGFEDVEALIPIDVLRRGGVDVVTVSIMDFPLVASAHGVNIETDIMFEQGDFSDADLHWCMQGSDEPVCCRKEGGSHLCSTSSSTCCYWCAQRKEGHMLSRIREGSGRSWRNIYWRPCYC